MGQEWEQSGNKNSKVGHLKDENNHKNSKVGQEWGQSGQKMGTKWEQELQWEQNGNKNFKVGQE